MKNLVSDAENTDNRLPNNNANVVKLAPLRSESPYSLVEAKGVCSVVIVSYKTGEVLMDCIRSVLGQSKLHQLILVDNGNTRQTVQQLNEIADKNSKFEIITGHGNVGFSQKSTRGIYSSIKPRFYITSRHSHSSIGSFSNSPRHLTSYC